VGPRRRHWVAAAGRPHASQSLIGTKLGQQICIRQIVLKHMPKISVK